MANAWLEYVDFYFCIVRIGSLKFVRAPKSDKFETLTNNLIKR